MAQPSDHIEIIRVSLTDGIRAAVLAKMTDGSVPAARQWKNLQSRVATSFKSRLGTVLQAQWTDLPEEMIRNLGEGIIYVKIRHPRWRAIAFKEGYNIHVVDFLFDPSNQQVSAAQTRAVAMKSHFIAYVPSNEHS